ncbi:MAG: ABC transporter permease [candidate division KSB1 bacterium]|nr:ABC transporter permease [candidate division KSB1 bacterium]
MRPVLVLVRKELLQRIRGKGFWIGAILFPVLVVGMSVLPALFMRLSAGKEHRIAVVDLTGRLTEASSLLGAGGQYRFQIYRCDSTELPRLREDLLGQIRRNQLEGVVVVPAGAIGGPATPMELYAKNISSFERNEAVRARISSGVIELRLLQKGLDPQTVLSLMHPLPLRTFKVQKAGAEERSGGVEFLVVYLMVLSLYMTIILYGTSVLRAVIEDKSSRAVEIILSLVRPGQLMAGKILGVGSAGLLQYFLWVVILLAVFVLGGDWMQAKLGQEFRVTVSPGTIAAFVVFFVLGYLLYSTLWAALGAMVNNEAEAQSLQYPLVMLLVVPFMAMFHTINAPHSTVSVVLSLIPFFAPILMFVRIAIDPPSLVQIASSIVLMILALWASIWVVGRIFRVGILMIGKRATLPEVVRWLRYG